jgi:hypothetical protein
VVTDRTLSVTEATDRITLATRLAQEAKDALVAAKADLAEAEEAEKKAPAGAKGAAAQRVYAANKAVTAALTQKTLRDAEHQAAIESRDTAEKNLAAATRAKLNADTDLAVKRRVLQRAQDLQNPIRTSLNNFDTSVEDLEGLITQAKESAGFIYNCMELAHLATTLEMDATGDELKVELAFAPRPPDVTIVNGETTANGPPGTRTGAPAGLPTVESGPIMAPGTRTFPVDFGLFRSMSPSYSVGLVRSALRDDNPRSIDNGDGTFTIFPGVRSEPTVKPIALLHLNIYKSGGLYTGPALGVIGSNYWAGWGVQLGRVNDRLSLNLGYEFGTVKRLNGVSYGTGQIPGSSLTTDVKRSSPALSITYSFKIPTGT